MRIERKENSYVWVFVGDYSVLVDSVDISDNDVVAYYEKAEKEEKVKGFVLRNGIVEIRERILKKK